MEYLLVLLAALVSGVNSGHMIGIIDEVWDVMSLVMKESRPSGVQVHDAGDTIELHCQANQADMVNWTYPGLGSESAYYGVVNVVTRPVGDDMEVSVLTVTNATHEDTGRYECFCSAMQDFEHSLVHTRNQLIGRRSIYIFVRDDEHLLKGSSHDGPQAILASARDELAIPCISTDPEATVTLHKGGHPAELPPPVTVDNARVYYDDRYGFRIENVGVSDAGGYSCVATKSNVTDIRYYLVIIQSDRPLIMEPVVTARSRFVHLGTPALLKCQVAVGRHQLTYIEWYKETEGQYSEITPESRPGTHTELSFRDRLCSGLRDRCSFTHRSFPSLPYFQQYRTVISRLRFNSFSADDNGNYYCKVYSGTGQRVSNSINLVASDLNSLLAQGYLPSSPWNSRSGVISLSSAE